MLMSFTVQIVTFVRTPIPSSEQSRSINLYNVVDKKGWKSSDQ